MKIKRQKICKVPVVMQLEALECGAACLTMILAYYNKWIPLEQVRADCGVSRDGSNAKNIIMAARSYGLDAKGYRYEPEDLRKSGSFPCIVHWEFNHFIVCRGIKGGKVYINDPARGELVISEEEFDEGFTGIVLKMCPSPDFKAEGKRKSTVEFARKRIKGAETAIAFVVLTTVISNLIGLIQPGFSRIFIDRLLSGKNPEWAAPFFMLLFAVSLVQITVQWLNAIYSLKINGKMAVYGNTSYLWKVLRLPMEFFSQRMAGDIQQRQSTNAGIAGNIVNTFAPLVLNSIMMVFYLILMFRYSVMLAIVGLSAIIINYLLSRLISKKRVNLTRVSMRDAGKLYGCTVNGIQTIETLKASGAEDGFFEKWAGYQASVNNDYVKFKRLDASLGLVPSAVSVLTGNIVLILGVSLVLRGEFTVGQILAFQGFMQSFSAPAASLISASQTLSEMRTEMERVEDVMEYPTAPCFRTEEEMRDDIVYDKLLGELELKNICFGYSKLAEPLIKDFSIKIPRGSKIAFVGKSGCGKSTISKLISGLYEPWSGEILFDGRDKSCYDRSVLTGSVAVVDQDITIFEDSIANNIKMWDESIADFEMILGARDARIHDTVMKRDGGYNYKITDGGRDFSGGEIQRLEIARVLAQDPRIIILDEATSALDAKTENEVVNAITDRGITCIIIAHRLSTVRNCDKILVMDHGRIIEEGTHDELYALGGYYTGLVTDE